MKRAFASLIFLIAMAAGLYTQRVEIAEWVREASAPELPEAVGYEEAGQRGVIPSPDASVGVEGSPGDGSDEHGDSSVDDELPRNDNDPQELIDEARTEEEAPLPLSVNLAVPFTPQAPYGNWGPPYKEACEEASVYMLAQYYGGVAEGLVPAQTADEDLQRIVAFERELFGYYEDTTAEQTGVLAEMMFGLTYSLIEDPTVDRIKEELAQGHPVIVPAAGRLLGNPYFTAPGPVYHMLVIRGYTADGRFIVNDPGTYRGEAYVYDFDTVMNAMHDWNGGEEITEGGKVVLVLYP